MINILREIEDYNEYDLYKDLDISLLKQNYIDKQAILFEDFYDLCKRLNVNIDID
jgi:hypothetical protein